MVYILAETNLYIQLRILSGVFLSSEVITYLFANGF